MRPATQETLEAAARLIINSIADQNGTEYHCTTKESNGTIISTVDKKMQALEYTVEAMRSILHPRLATVCKQHNSLIPIAQLPTETLSMILIQSTEASVRNWSSRDWMMNGRHRQPRPKYMRAAELSRVSTLWKNVIDNTPYFWTDLHPRYPKSLWDLIVSKPFPLQVDWQPYPPNSRQSGTTFQPSLEAVCPTIKRWKSFKFVTCTQEALEALERQGSAPLLEKLELRLRPEIRRTQQPSCAFNIFGGLIPSLQQLSLFSISVPWSSSFLNDLKVLELQEVHNACPSVRDIREILTSSPKLEILKMEACHIRADDETRATRPVIQLLSLHTLRIGNVPLPVTKAILSSIYAPNCKEFGLEPRPCDQQGLSSLLDDSPTDHWQHWLASYLSTAKHVWITVDSDLELSFTVHPKLRPGDASPPVKIALHESVCVTSSLETLLNVMPVSDKHTTSLTVANGSLADDHVFSHLSRLPNVLQVVLFGFNADFRPFIRRLMQPIEVPSGGPQWVFPRLADVSLTYGTIDGPELYAVVRERGLASQSPGQQAGPVCALDSLALCGTNVPDDGSLTGISEWIPAGKLSLAFEDVGEPMDFMEGFEP